MPYWSFFAPGILFLVLFSALSDIDRVAVGCPDRLVLKGGTVPKFQCMAQHS